MPTIAQGATYCDSVPAPYDKSGSPDAALTISLYWTYADALNGTNGQQFGSAITTGYANGRYWFSATAPTNNGDYRITGSVVDATGRTVNFSTDKIAVNATGFPAVDEQALNGTKYGTETNAGGMAASVKASTDVASGLPQVNVPANSAIPGPFLMLVGSSGSTIRTTIPCLGYNSGIGNPTSGNPAWGDGTISIAWFVTEWVMQIGSDYWALSNTLLQGPFGTFLPLGGAVGSITVSPYIDASIKADAQTGAAAALAVAFPNAPKVDLIDVPNATAVTAIQAGLSKPGTAQTITAPYSLAQIAAALWQDATAGDFTVTGSAGKQLFALLQATDARLPATVIAAKTDVPTAAQNAAAVAASVPPAGFFINATLGGGSGSHVCVVNLTNGGTPPIPLPGVSVTIYTDAGHTQQAAGTGIVLTNNLGNATFNLLAGGQFYWLATLTGYGSTSGSIAVS